MTLISHRFLRDTSSVCSVAPLFHVFLVISSLAYLTFAICFDCSSLSMSLSYDFAE